VDILVCVKRVPTVGGQVQLTADGQDVDTRASGFTVSPHEECAVEEAIQLTERLGGTVTVLTLGPPAAAAQLRDMLALGAHGGVLLETDGREWGPVATAAAIAAAVRGLDRSFPLILCGNEAADTGGYQVGIRLAHALGRPCATGIKRLEVTGGELRAGRERGGAVEEFTLPLPAVVGVKEGINLPRYPSLPGRLRAKRAEITMLRPEWQPDGLRKERLRVPVAPPQQATMLGQGAAAVPALLRVLGELGVLAGSSRPGPAVPGGAAVGGGPAAAGGPARGGDTG
jgi:electron transfer flavoprotein beta subunit